jgi:AraC family transcriptional regulator
MAQRVRLARVVEADRLRRILDVVQDGLDDPELTGADLAALAYLSRFHFDRLVRAGLGEPPGAFRRRLLLERSAHRLVATSDPVIEIASHAGFGSPEAFARAFARAYGAAPTAYRRSKQHPLSHDLPAPSRIHFRSPGGLLLPAETRSTAMDVLLKLADHHLDLVGQIIDRTASLDDDVLDRPIELSIEGIDANPSLRSVTDRLVSQLEMWNAALDGGTSMPEPEDSTPAGMRRRLGGAAPRFRQLVIEPVRDGRADETFIDAICEPPETFTLGGVLAHVLTFSAVRRTMAIGALETAGISDLGSGDPMHYVGGHGDDASTITRRSE